MAIKINNYQFEGPYTSMNKLKNKTGIYVVHTKTKNKYYIIDIGESTMIRDRLKRHERMKCWLRHSKGGEISVSVYYTNHWSQNGRSKFVEKLRKKYNPPCGKSKLDGKLNFISP